MSFCTECGQDHHAGDREETAALDREVEIARINANRDVKVAQVTAGMVRETTETEAGAAVDIAETEAVAGVEAAEAVADVLADVVAPPEAEAAPPVIIDAPAAEPELPEVEPPPAAEHHGEPAESSSGYGNSAWFGGR
jgi:hypothetical protein